MLLIGRKAGQAVTIEDHTLVTVMEVEGGRARLCVSRKGRGDHVAIDETLSDAWVEIGGRIAVEPEVFCSIHSIREDVVRVGIQAPARYQIHRKEVYDAINREG